LRLTGAPSRDDELVTASCGELPSGLQMNPSQKLGLRPFRLEASWSERGVVQVLQRAQQTEPNICNLFCHIAWNVLAVNGPTRQTVDIHERRDNFRREHFARTEFPGHRPERKRPSGCIAQLVRIEVANLAFEVNAELRQTQRRVPLNQLLNSWSA
jgi:hypothetical protein